MDLFIYTDESGVLDKVHQKYYTYGGIVPLGKDEKDGCSRKFLSAERAIRFGGNHRKGAELKANSISNAEKGKLFRSLNQVIKFGVIIDQSRIRNEIFDHKKSKQRYLDYAYKIGLKRCLEELIHRGSISDGSMNNIHIFADEHTTATNGRYELKESLEAEFNIGTYNYNYSKFYPPIFPSRPTIDLRYCNSEYVGRDVGFHLKI